MCEMWYNTGVVNHIGSRGDVSPSRGLGNCVGGTATMSHHNPDASSVKTCSKCGESKPLSEYSKYRDGGYKTACKSCAAFDARERRAADPERARGIKRRSYARNRERWCAEISARIANDPEYREKRNERKRRWHSHNRTYVSAYRAEYYAANAEKVRRQSSEMRQKYPQRYIARYRVAGAVRRGDFPPAWTMVCERCQENQANAWHHHKGYDHENWPYVIALCLDCHGKEHRSP